MSKTTGCPISALGFVSSHQTTAGDEEETLNQELAKGKRTETGDVGSMRSRNIRCAWAPGVSTALCRCLTHGLVAPRPAWRAIFSAGPTECVYQVSIGKWNIGRVSSDRAECSGKLHVVQTC